MTKPPRAQPNPPPKHLKAETRKWWSGVVREYQLEAHHVKLLTAAAETWDRYEEARETLRKEGSYYTDSRGNPRAHPAIAVERDARLAFARLLRELDLDVDPPRAPSRPPAFY